MYTLFIDILDFSAFLGYNIYIMEMKYLEKIEFNKIIEILSSFAVTDVGKQYCMSLLPEINKEKVQHLINETTEATILRYRKGAPPLVQIADISEYLKILQGNSAISSIALLHIAHILKICRELKEYLEADIDISNLSIINRYFNNLYSNPKIENTILSAIIDENTIDDRASTTLTNIRRNKRKLEQDIKKNLANLLNSKYIQEPIVTIRNDRFVIPVKNEYRSEIKGLIHDISSSGSTVFIEPFSVFELNNQINSLRIEESIEIEKILYNLSSMLFDITEELENNIRLIGLIDFSFAKANYAISINATEPIINNDKFIDLKSARHPLIQPDIVVPINISIGKDYTSLVITGPNTGGKTVTLKTVALLTAMAMSGLYIPAAEHSSVYVFSQIFADIGDEQSISQSLSTFSSHLTNIVEITNNADNESLVILDELGSGTDPVQGAYLGISILDFLHQKGCITLTTTHYPEVKNYALTTPGFENASSEFDLTTLSPTYRLLIGVPGKSMAFEIAQKLGLENSILEKAKSQVSSNVIDTEELLKNIYDDKLLIEKEKEKILASSSKIEALQNDLVKQKNELETTQKDIINNAKIEAKDILLEAKKDADRIIKQLSSENNTNNKLRKELNSKIQNMNIEKPVITTPTISKVEIGMSVFVPSLNQDGTVVSKPNKNNVVTVQIGSAKMQLKVDSLSPAKSQVTKKTIPTSTTSNLKAKFVNTEINVLGYNVDEAIFVIDKFLDDCAIAKLKQARIVHGKGTGALRKGIHDFLKKHPHVKSYRLGTFGEGEMGVTIVEIK